MIRRIFPPSACCALALLGLAPLHAQAPAFGTTFTVTQAQAEVKAGRFDRALAVLQAPHSVPPADAKALRLAVADVQYAWAQSLLTTSPAQALPHYQAALATDRTLRPAQAAADLNETAVAYVGLRRPVAAIGSFQQALPFYQKVGDKDGQGNTLMGLGIMYFSLHQPGEAVGFLQRALPFYRQAGDKEGQANVLNNLGNVYRSGGQSGKAAGFYRQAVLFYQQAGDKGGAAGALKSLSATRERPASR